MLPRRIPLLALCAVAAVGAQSWKRAPGIDSTRGVYSTAVHGGAFFAATDTLVYRSEDLGLSWAPLAAQPAPGAPAYYVLHSHATGLYAATDAHGVLRSVDGGGSWSPVGAGLPGEPVLALASLGDSLYAGLGFSGIYVLNLANPGAWAPCNTGLTQFGANWIGAAGGRLFAGMGAGLFVRERGGDRWREASWGDGFQRQVFEVVALDSFFFAATEAGVFRASAADPLSWEAKDIAPMKGRDILALAVQGKRLYAGLNQSLQHWIWSSDDAGLTWDVRAHEYAEIFGLRFTGDRLWAERADGLFFYDFPPARLRPAARPAAGTPIRPGARRVDGRRTRLQNRSMEITLPLRPSGDARGSGER